jgi:RHS repeat-associated protein
VKIPIDTDNDFIKDLYRVSIRNISDYSPFGVGLVGRTVESEVYRFGFNGMEKDDEVKGDGNSYDFGARMLDCRIGRWLKTDAKMSKYPGYSPFHFGYDNPIITIDADGNENIVVIGNQGHSPASDFNNGKPAEGYRYGQNNRHFLEAGLNEAIRLKKDETDNKEGTTMIIYKGNYSSKELAHYAKKAKKAGITFLEVSSAQQITNYVNAKDIKGNTPYEYIFGGDRQEDKISDFSYVGHGWTEALYTGYNAIEDGADFDALYTTTFEARSFDVKCDVNLNACGSGFKVMDDFVNRLVGGTVTGYNVTIQWGEKGLGTSRPFELFYYPPNDPRRDSEERPIVPEKDRTRKEKGKRVN